MFVLAKPTKNINLTKAIAFEEKVRLPLSRGDIEETGIPLEKCKMLCLESTIDKHRKPTLMPSLYSSPVEAELQFIYLFYISFLASHFSHLISLTYICVLKTQIGYDI